MAVPAKRKFKHYRGDDFRYSFRVETYVDAEDPDAGTVARDLTEWGVNFESDPDVEGVEINGAAWDSATPTSPFDDTGVVTVFIPAEALGEDQQDTVEFDVQLVTPDGFRRTYIHVIIALQSQVS